MNLDIGFLTGVPEGYVRLENPQVYPWDIKDNSVEIVTCVHYLQKVVDLHRFMEEVYRICMSDTPFKIIVPYYTSYRSISDPTHIRQFSEYSFMYFNKEMRKNNGIKEEINCDFNVYGIAYTWSGIWNSKSEEAKEHARIHYNNVVDDMVVELRCKK